MSGGENTKFKRDPAGYASERVILVPAQDTLGFWGVVKDGPFDLARVADSGFDGDVVILSHMDRREKGQTKGTNRIAGIWVPYEPDQLKSWEVTATTNPYFVFTSKLGGCALGMKDANLARTTFYHDATEAQREHLGQCALTLFPQSYDTSRKNNVTAFFWWDGTKWQLGRSLIYNAHGFTQTVGLDKYPQKKG